MWPITLCNKSLITISVNENPRATYVQETLHYKKEIAVWKNTIQTG